MKLSLLTLFLVFITLCSTQAEGLPAPTNLLVKQVDDRFAGRWDAVEGASYYQVWVKAFGRWSFHEKTLETSPFTSSFELKTEDERSLFKVRAVGPNGTVGAFSEEVPAVQQQSVAPEVLNHEQSASEGSEQGAFDPKATAPEPPTSLFAVWIEQGVIKLVWQVSVGAKNYAVEELMGPKWTSVSRIEFPKSNTALISGHPAPGPYRFRVRAVGKNGRASEPSRSTTIQR